jgi:hypothetical protein
MPSAKPVQKTVLKIAKLADFNFPKEYLRHSERF